jgi:glycosyltransferase involved in cell wall biosynthesis
MILELSVIVPTHNPRMDYLQSTLDALRAQTLPASRWELLVVDNRSEPSLADRLDLGWHPYAAVVREEQLGLTRARVAGFGRAHGQLVVLVDDDNVLTADYLEQTLKIAAEYLWLGTWGGGITPRYEDPGLAITESLHPLLTLRTVSGNIWSNDINHHSSTPWGAGLCIRRTVAEQYAKEISEAPKRVNLDLQGQSLLYGGDTDITFTGCRMGLGKGVFPRLQLEHLIPKHRCAPEYLCRVAEGRGYSAVLHHLLLHGQLPPPPRPWNPVAWARLLYGRAKLSAVEYQVEVAHERGYRRAFAELSNQSTA